MSWLYNNSKLEHLPDKKYKAFVYRIDISDKYYFGIKSLYTNKELPSLKTDKVRDGFVGKSKKYVYRRDDVSIITKNSEKKGLKAKIETYDMVIVESNWKNYCSSSEDVKKLVVKGHTPTRTIIRLCESVKEARYFEEKLLFEHVGIEDCLNGNCGGRYFLEEILTWLSI